MVPVKYISCTTGSNIFSGCSMAGFETLLEVAEIYQIRVEDLIQEIKESD